MSKISKKSIYFVVILTFIFGSFFFASKALAEDFWIKTGVDFYPQNNTNSNYNNNQWYSNQGYNNSQNYNPYYYNNPNNYPNYNYNQGYYYNYQNQNYNPGYYNRYGVDFYPSRETTQASTTNNYTTNKYYSNNSTQNTSKTTATTTTKKTNTTKTNKDTTIDENDNVSNGQRLAAGVLWGNDTFLPSGFLQWLVFFFLLLLAIILWRKLYVNDRERNKPLKHA